MVTKTICSGCQAELKISSKLLGREIVCPKCGESFVGAEAVQEEALEEPIEIIDEDDLTLAEDAEVEEVSQEAEAGFDLGSLDLSQLEEETSAAEEAFGIPEAEGTEVLDLGNLDLDEELSAGPLDSVSDPLGVPVGDPLAAPELDALAVGASDPLSQPVVAAGASTPGQNAWMPKTKEKPQETSSGLTPEQKKWLAIGGGGAAGFVGVLLIGLLGWYLFSGGDSGSGNQLADAGGDREAQAPANPTPSGQTPDSDDEGGNPSGSSSDGGESPSSSSGAAIAAPPPTNSSRSPQNAQWLDRQATAHKANQRIYFSLRGSGNSGTVVHALHNVRETLKGFPTNESSEPSSGQGVPLSETDLAFVGFSWNQGQYQNPNLVQAQHESENARVLRLSAFGTPSYVNGGSLSGKDAENISHHKHVWAEDGKTLYVLSGNAMKKEYGRSRFLKVDTESWEIEQEFIPGSFDINDFTLTSEGIVVATSHRDLSQFGGYFRRDSDIWAPLFGSREYDTILLLLDPQSCKIKKAWSSPRVHRVAGSPNKPIIFTSHQSKYLAAVDLRSGQLLNVTYSEKEEFGRLRMTRDGQWLLTCRQNNELRRYKVEGTEVRFEQKTAIPDCAYDLSDDESLIAFRARRRLGSERGSVANTLWVAKLSNFDAIVGSTALPGDGLLAVSNQTNHVYGYTAQLPRTRGATIKSSERQKYISFLSLFSSSDFWQVKFEDEEGVSSLPKGDDATKGRIYNFERTKAPLGMSSSPDGRGAIIFDNFFAFWIEAKQKSTDLGISKPTAIVKNLKPGSESQGFVSGLADGRAAQMQESVPSATAGSLRFANRNDASKGRAYYAPDGSIIRAAHINPENGDIAVCVYDVFGGETSRYSVNLIKGSDMLPNEILASRRLEFKEPPPGVKMEGGPLNASFQKVDGRMLLAVTRFHTLYLYDAQTLGLIDADSGLVPKIDLEEAGVDAEGGLEISIFANIDPAVSHLVRCGYARNGDRRPTTFMLNLRTGIAEREPSSSLDNPTKTNVTERYSPSLLDPYGDVEFEYSPPGVTSLGKQFLLPNPDRHTSPLAVLRARPWVAFSDPKNMRFIGRYDVSQNFDLPLPAKLQRDERLSGSIMHFLLDDPGRKRFVLFGKPDNYKVPDEEKLGSALWVCRYADAGIPERPVVAVALKNRNVEFGATSSIQFDVPDPRVKIRVKSGPPGAKVAGNVVSWNPKFSDLGTQTIEIVASAGQQEITKKIEYSLGLKRAPVSFPVINAEFSLDGKRLATWGRDGELALLDSDTSTIIWEKKLGQGVIDCVVNAQTVGVLLQDGMTVKVIAQSAPDKSLDFSLTKKIKRIELLGERHLALQQQHGNADLVRSYPRLGDSKLAKILEGTNPEGRFGLASVGKDSWMFGPIILDKNIQRVEAMGSLQWSSLEFAEAAITASSGINADSSEMYRRGPNPNGGKLMLFGGRLNIQSALEKAASSRDDRYSEDLVLTIQDTDEIIFKGSVANAARVNNALVTRDPILTQDKSRIIFFLNGGLYVTRLSDFKVNVRSYQAARTDLGPQLSTKSFATVLGRGLSTLKFTAKGGKPPYKYSGQLLAVQRAPEAERQVMVQVNERTGVTKLNGQRIIEAAQIPFRGWAQILMRNRGNEKTNEGAGIKELLDQYLEEVNADLQGIVRKPFRDIPIGLRLAVFVEDSTGAKTTLTHDCIATIPKDQALDLLSQHQRRSSMYGNQLEMPEVDLPLVWEATPLKISESYRKRWPPLPASKLNELKRDYLQYRLVRNFSASRNGPQLPARDWKIKTGRIFHGSIVSIDSTFISGRFRGTMIVKEPDEKYRTDQINISELTDDSLLQAISDLQNKPREAYRYTDAEQPNSRTDISTGSRRSPIGEALRKFYEDYGCLPPAAIVDKNGRPLISWRVMLLPYMGHNELFRQFDLNEPWDSKNNRPLLKYLPTKFVCFDDELDVGKTCWVAGGGQDSAFPLDAIKRPSSFDKFEDTPLVWMAAKENAVEWTKPQDLDENWKGQIREQSSKYGPFYDAILGDWKIHGIRLQE